MVCSRTVTLAPPVPPAGALPALATTMSARPSPSRSASATPCGRSPAANSVAVNAPSGAWWSTAAPAAVASTTSARPSASMRPTATSVDPRPAPTGSAIGAGSTAGRAGSCASSSTRPLASTASATNTSARVSGVSWPIAAAPAAPPVGIVAAARNRPGLATSCRSTDTTPVSETAPDCRGCVSGDAATRSGRPSPSRSPTPSPHGSAATGWRTGSPNVPPAAWR